MKYLKVFETDTDQQNYINGEFDRPNITIVRHKKQTINYVSNIIDDDENAGSGGKFYINCVQFGSVLLTFTIESPKTWNECIGLKDDTGNAEIIYDEVMPGGPYRFTIIYYDGLLDVYYAIETDEDGNTPTPEDFIKIDTTYTAYQL